jgi:Ca2+-binding RTX toxin-like protein
LPIDLTGNYRLLVSTDINSNVLESTENNNSLASTTIPVALSVTPDLIVQSVDAPTQAIAGQGLNLTWTVANNGASNANQVWYDSVYLSLDQTFDRNSDIYLGYQTHTGGLAAGGTYTTTQNFNVPRGLGGRYFAFVVTDAGNSVYERLGEANNTNYDGLSTEVIIPPPSDLVVTGVTVPTTGVLGQPVAISYTVQNQGTSSAVGSWNDALYLSTDTVWDINDVSIGQAFHTGDIASGESYTGSLNAILPGVSAGNYHVVVRSDIRNQVVEVNDANNANASTNTIALGVEALTLGTPDSDVLQQGQSIYYRFDAVAGQAVRLRLDSSQNQSSNELYVRFGNVPTRGQFDLTTNQPFNADPEIIIPIEQTGTYYVLAYGDQVSGNPAYSIVAEDIPFSLTGVQTNKIGNLGESTLEVRGAKFSAGTQFELVGANGQILQSSKVLLKNSTLAYVTFNLANDALGAYDVRAVAGENTAILNDVVTVEASKAYDVDASITGLNEVRPSRNYQFDVNYLNKGNSDSIAPLLIIENNGGTNIGTTIGDVAVRPSLQVLGVSRNGDSQIVRPGELNSLSLYFNTNTDAVDFSVKTYLADNTTAINWNTFGESIRPIDVTNTQWNNFISNIAPVVTTYGAYVRMVNDISRQISPVGVPIYDVRQLFGQLYVVSPNYQPFTLPGVTLPQPPVPGVPDADNDNDRNNGNDGYKPLVRRSLDPNDILGPKGFGENQWIDTDEPLKYTIRFENAATATAPAQQVVITQQLDADLDYRTFRIDDYGWSGAVYDVATNQPTYRTQIDLTATRGILVNVEATISVTGLATWRISSIDPATGEPPLNAQSGFLPIDDMNGLGEGFVSYTIRANTNRQPAQTGAVIEAQAEIVFDTEAPIATPVISNILDVSKPISSVLPLATTSETPEFLVKWSGTDEGSALATYTIYVSDNNGAYTAWLTATDLTEATYTGIAGHNYQFYSVATDNAGNSQIVPTTAQATIQVAVENVPPTAVTLTNVVSSLAENTSTVDRVKVADINLTDDGLGNNALSLSGADASSFEIFDGDLYIKAGTILDFEPQSNYAVTVAVDDISAGATPDAAADFSFTVTDAVESIIGISADPETLNGGRGDDYLNGGVGDDYLNGGAGNDVLDGSGDSTGLNTFAGGTGDDIYGVYNSSTIIIEEVSAGIDTVWTEVNYTISANVENLYLIGDTAGTGNAGDNIITGYGAGNNTINGGAGRDTLYGGDGRDILIGGLGADYLDGGADNDVLDGAGDSISLDTFAGGAGDDAYGVYNSDTIIVEEAGGGIDTVWTQVDYTLSTNVENLYLVGDIAGAGNAGDNIISGYGVGNNTINGGAGRDNLIGGLGADYLDGGADNDVLDGSGDSVGLDTFAGGAGDDVYSVYNSDTIIVEETGAGIDTVWTQVNYTISANVENLYLVGDIAGIGNAGDNIISGYGVGNNTINGGAGRDSLYGGDGRDSLIGGLGADYLDGGADNDVLDGSGDTIGLDTFAGGTGDDVYGVYNSGTIIIENAGAGTDSVWTEENYTLAANVEILYLTSNNTGTGNADANTIVGYGAGDNIIDGGDGIDNLFGGAGNDTFILSKTSADNIGDFGVGNDRLQISASAFGGGLAAGVALQAGQLLLGANTADTVDRRFIFDTTNGDLFFDADGSDTTSIAIKIGKLSGTSSLNVGNFVIV